VVVVVVESAAQRARLRQARIRRVRHDAGKAAGEESYKLCNFSSDESVLLSRESDVSGSGSGSGWETASEVEGR
jgi:hypothetical protein